MGRMLVVMLCLGLAGVALGQDEYGLGLIAEDDRPDWVLPSPIDGNIGLDELDEVVDNSAGLPPVDSQGGQGSCTAWATGYYWLGYMQGLDYGWDLTDHANQMSPSFVYNQINGGGDNGSAISHAFQLFEEVGCGRWVDQPYNVNDCTIFPPEAAFRSAPQFRTSATYEINTGSMYGVNQLRAHVAAGGMAVIGITVYPNFDSIDYYDYNYCVNDIYGEIRGGHAVTVVGYDDSRVTSDGVGAFKMVNSWGTGWGDDGFWWISYEAIMSDQICHGYAMYGADREDYEPTILARIAVEHEDRYNVAWEVGIGDPDQPVFEHRALDFNRWWGSALHPYPEGAALWLDLTDGAALIDPDTPNTMFARGEDEETYNGHDGQINAVMMCDVSVDFAAGCEGVPVTIPDNGTGEGAAEVVFYYAAVPPEPVQAEVDLTDGIVNLAWDPIEELPDFQEYNVFRDGEWIGATDQPSYSDGLQEFGVYSYQVSSVWDICESWPSDVAMVDYITGVPPTYLSVETGYPDDDDSPVPFTLHWEQQRDATLALDDGASDQPLTLNANCLPGAMIAQRFEADNVGDLTHLSVWMDEETEPGCQIQLRVLADDGGDQPGEVISTSPWFAADPLTWAQADLGANRVSVGPGETFWLAIAFEDPAAGAVGYDISGSADGKALAPDGVNWLPLLGNSGVVMLRATLGVNETVAGDTGLMAWEVYLDDELYATVDGPMPSTGGMLDPGEDHTFRVDAIYQQGTWQGDELLYMWTGVAEHTASQPNSYTMHHPMPNPFNASSVVGITLADRAPLTVRIYNMLGQEVLTLVDEIRPAGYQSVLLPASSLASGMYLVHATVPGHLNEMRKVVCLK